MTGNGLREKMSWPTAGGNGARTGVSQADITLPLELSWTFPDCSPIQGGIVASDNLIVFSDNQGMLYAIDASSKQLKWTYPLDGPSSGTPVLTESRLYFGNSFTAFCLDLDNGKEIWKTQAQKRKIPEKSVNCPLLKNDHIIFSDQFCTFYHKDTGEVVKSINISSEPHPNTGPCADDNLIYIPSYKKIEIFSTESLKPAGSIPLDNTITSGPVVFNDYLAVGMNDSSVEVISVKNQLRAWNYIFSRREYRIVLSRPICAGGMLYIGDPFGMIYAFDIISGKPKWEHHYFERIDSSMVLSGNQLFVQGNEYLFAISRDSGDLLWERGFDSSKVIFPVTSSPAIMQNSILIGREKLYVFSAV